MIEARGTNGRVTFDGVLVTIHRGGARSWVRGTGVRSIPARALTAVELQPAGFGRGWIRFAVDGADGEADLDDAYDDDLDEDDLDADRFDPAKDPNTVLFTRGRQRAFEDVRREVKTAMWEVGRHGDGDDEDHEHREDHTPTRPLPPHDPVRELRLLGQLLRDGVLSRPEFDRAKARLLDRI